MAKLLLLRGDQDIREWDLEFGENSVGRQRSNNIVISDPRVSRRHFTIFVDEHQVVLISQSTTQATYVNGIRIQDRIGLDDGDQIKLGEFLLGYYASDRSAREARLSHTNEPYDLSGHEISVAGPPAGDEANFEVIAKIKSSEISDFGDGESDSKKMSKLYRRLVLIQEIGQQLVAELDLKALFSMILEKIFSLLTVDTGVVLLFEAANRRVIPVAVRDAQGASDGTKMNISRSLVQFAVHNRVGVLSADTKKDERFHEEMSIIHRGINSAMCVPFIHQDEILGVIYVENSESLYTFTEEDLSLLTILANQAAVAVRNAKLCKQVLSEENKRNNLSRYLTPQLVESITKDEVALTLGGKQVRCAILFSDIRGFTSLSEKLAPDAVVTMLNEYFTAMTDIIFKYNGTLDKYVGDAVIAAFGSPVSDDDACLNALRCSVEMLNRLGETSFGGMNFEVGIGLHFGEVIHGNVGSERIMQYTVIGDTVNTASRLCGGAPGDKILMSREFVDGVGRDFPIHELDPVKLKGKSESIPLFEFAGKLKHLEDAEIPPPPAGATPLPATAAADAGQATPHDDGGATASQPTARPESAAQAATPTPIPDAQAATPPPTRTPGVNEPGAEKPGTSSDPTQSQQA